MQKKQVSIIPRSMQKDLAVNQFPADAAFDIRNMRIVTTGNNTSLCLVNEKSNSKETNVSINGTVIGTQVVGKCVVLFTVNGGTSYIYKVSKSDNNLASTLLYSGNLGFSLDHPIESIGIYENEEIQKVYWVDGINQPRFINICKTYSSGNGTQFDFIQEVVDSNGEFPQVTLSIDVVQGVNATLPAGVIQYAVSYFNKNGQQTPIVYQSPLYYISDNGRGLSPDGSQLSSSAFRLVIGNLDTNFDYCRVYRIARTSIDGTPIVESIGDYKIETSSYEEETSATKLTNNGGLALAYGSTDFFIGSGYITKPGGLCSSAELSANKLILKSRGLYCLAIINSQYSIDGELVDPTTNKPFYIKDFSTGFIYTIPKDKTILITQRASDNQVYLDKEYTLEIVDPTDLSPLEEEITGVRTVSGLILYDTGTTGTAVDPTELLYLGGTEVVAGTLSHKDGTLFVGNISTNKFNISNNAKTYIKNNCSLQYELEDVKDNEDGASYLDEQWILNSNLLKGNDKVTFFQKGEVYRFGIQFLSKRGIWSEVTHLKDITNGIRVVPNRYNDGIAQRPVLKATVNLPQDIRGEFIAARLVCVYPTINDRNVLCQGIVCSTLYNLKDRNDNSPYVQSSWFARPDYSRYNEFGKIYIASYKENLRRGSPLEYRMVDKVPDEENTMAHFEDAVVGLPSARKFNGEIFGCGSAPQSKTLEGTGGDTRVDVINKFQNIHGIDKRVVTMHSPELDDAFDDAIQNISLSGVKFRVVGYAPVKTTFSDINIAYSNPFVPNFSGPIDGITISSPSTSYSYISGYSLVNYPLWLDGIALGTNETSPGSTGGVKGYASFPVYPWHRNGSLSNQGKTDTSDNRKSLLKSKVMSNLRICLPSKYLGASSEYPMSISNVELWGGNENNNSIKKLNTRSLWGISQDIIYRGNIDKLIPFTGSGDYGEVGVQVQSYGWGNDPYGTILENTELPSKDNEGDRDVYKYIKIRKTTPDKNNEGVINNVNRYSSDPVPIQYKSTGHAVFAFGKAIGTYAGRYEILPNISTGNYGSETVAYPRSSEDSDLYYYVSYRDKTWLLEEEEDGYKGIYQKTIQVNDDVLNHGREIRESIEGNVIVDANNTHAYYYIIGELYRDNVVNRFGGDTEQALSNNSWIVCSDAIPISDSTSIELKSTQGDTFFARYDHLKTYPNSNTDINQVVDIVSFMCETRINIDGRYDRNRGNTNNLTASPLNFNLFNKVYSQKNNYFKYSYLNPDDTIVTHFPNQIMWSKTKTMGESVDSWTNINATNVLDLDGDKGPITALRRLNNEIYAFQDAGISRVIYNPRVQITASDGVPIEIANSAKVNGKVYLSDKYGCQNKWSIAETPSGLYFVDDLKKSILSFNGQGIADLTYSKNMFSWMNNNYSLEPWSLSNQQPIRTVYDSINGDIYFTTDKEALAFNERLGAFSSFYNYEGVSHLFSLEGNTYQVKENEIWKLHGGLDYLNFFGYGNNHHYYSVSVIANPEFQTDKIFDAVEFRTNDTAKKEHHKTWVEMNDNMPTIHAQFNKYPFIFLTAENEYQESMSGTANLTKKFRTWRWRLGRSGRDRIRNPWVKLTMEGNNNSEMRLYDMAVTYYS